MCSGDTDAVLNIRMSIFEKMAAKDKGGKPCVA